MRQSRKARAERLLGSSISARKLCKLEKNRGQNIEIPILLLLFSVLELIQSDI